MHSVVRKRPTLRTELPTVDPFENEIGAFRTFGRSAYRQCVGLGTADLEREPPVGFRRPTSNGSAERMSGGEGTVTPSLDEIAGELLARFSAEEGRVRRPDQGRRAGRRGGALRSARNRDWLPRVGEPRGRQDSRSGGRCGPCLGIATWAVARPLPDAKQPRVRSRSDCRHAFVECATLLNVGTTSISRLT